MQVGFRVWDLAWADRDSYGPVCRVFVGRPRPGMPEKDIRRHCIPTGLQLRNLNEVTIMGIYSK